MSKSAGAQMRSTESAVHLRLTQTSCSPRGARGLCKTLRVSGMRDTERGVWLDDSGKSLSGKPGLEDAGSHYC